MNSYNIRFPLQDDKSKNLFFSMTRVTKDAYVSDLLLLLLTTKGERYYDPNYGTNLLKYIFEPNDTITINKIEEEIKNTVSQYIPQLRITNVTFNWLNDENNLPMSENQLNLNIKFVYTEDAFSEEGSLDLNF